MATHIREHVNHLHAFLSTGKSSINHLPNDVREDAIYGGAFELEFKIATPSSAAHQPVSFRTIYNSRQCDARPLRQQHPYIHLYFAGKCQLYGHIHCRFESEFGCQSFPSLPTTTLAVRANSTIRLTFGKKRTPERESPL